MGEGRGGLFNLAEDIGESRDLSKARPDMHARRQRRFDEWYKETMIEAEPRGPFKDY